ncbi:hypothetical protein [Paenibacillus thalictri]|uniref:hypothetical protein n=1 Tax=Paenibacillus thalictri TaxID=2527873 RepID=UPI0013EF30D5|nr:hypothetical protein [Paenibacillus thalictri]
MKNPATIIVMIALAGIIVNMMLYSVLIAPQLLEKSSVMSTLANLEGQKQLLDAKPIPAKVTDQDIETLVKQVPVNEESARVVSSLKEIEKSTGATVSNINFGDQKTNQDNLTNILSNAAKQGASAANPGTANSQGSQTSQGQGTGGPQQAPAPVTGAAGQNAAGQGISENNWNVVVTGTYPQVVDFMNRLYQMDRLINIKQWSLRATPAASNTQEPAQSEKMTLNLVLSMYTAAAYAGQFRSLPPLPVNAPEKRQDPTMTNEQFINMLKELAGAK